MDRLKMNIYRFAIMLLALCAFGGCVREDFTATPPQDGDGPSDPEGVDLVCYIDIDELMSSMELDTKADGDRDPAMNASIDNLSSLAFFIVEAEAPWRMVAYRIIAPPDTDNDEYYLDKNPETGVRSNILEDSRLEIFDIIEDRYNKDGQIVYVRPTDTYYASESYHDDQHYGCWDYDENGKLVLSDNCVGYNGFAALDDNNMIVTSNYGGITYPAYDKGINPTTNLPDANYPPDGMYDYTYTDSETPFKNYTAGDPMRKSGAIILTFKHDHPMHGDIEKLVRGDYYLLAIANFRESISNVVEHFENTYGGADIDFNETTNYIGTYIHQMITSNWKIASGIPPGEYNKLIGGAVSLSEVKIQPGGDVTLKNGTTPNPFIRSNRARIICTGSQKITLTPGNTNVYAYGVKRISSRTTFRISNYSSEDLTLSDFSLSDNFAQAATFLFHDAEDHSELYRPEWQGAPRVSSSKAIVPFPPLNDNGTESAGNSITVPAYTTNHVFFDALTYESGNPDGNTPLSYTITVSYGNAVTKTEKFDISVFNLDTGVPSPLYSIHRNDHVVVDIGVTYNTETQAIEFEVKPWTPKTNDIFFE